MIYKEQSLSLLNVPEKDRTLVSLTNKTAEFLAKFSMAGIAMGENMKIQIMTVTLRDGVECKVNHNGKAVPVAVIVLDGRVEWVKITEKENSFIKLLSKLMSVPCSVQPGKTQYLNCNGARYFKKDDAVSCGDYTGKVDNATQKNMTFSKPMNILDTEIKLAEEQVTLLFIW